MKIFLLLVCLNFCSLPASALEVEAPTVPPSASTRMPDNTDHFAEAVLELLQNAIQHIQPELFDAGRICLRIFVAVMLVSLAGTITDTKKGITNKVSTVMIGFLLIQNTNTLIHLASDTVQGIHDYGKLLLPVMTTALAAQGRTSTSAALYAGTAVFDTVLSSLIANLLIPLVYAYLMLAIGNTATGEDLLKRMRDFIKNAVTWCLKILLTIFTTYMSITGVISGTTDAAILKATKITISSVVPVVGGILSDASESVLISAAVMKNAAGVYGILAVLSIFLEPFLRIWLQYLMLKATAALCGILGNKEMTGLVEDFSAAMSLLAAMTGAVCLLLLISVVCFLRGVG